MGSQGTTSLLENRFIYLMRLANTWQGQAPNLANTETFEGFEQAA